MAARPDGRPAAAMAPLVVRGLHGLLSLRAERVGNRTRLTMVASRPPLQVLRAHDLDASLPDLATVTIASPSGGVLQGDRLQTAIELGPGARLRVGTQSATRIYRCPDAQADLSTEIVVGSRAYLELLPDPLVPYTGSRAAVTTRATVAFDGTLILSEIVTGGRLARGEAFDLERFESSLELTRPDGDLLAVDGLVLDSNADLSAGSIGRVGRHLAVGTLYVVHREFTSEVLRAAADSTDGAVSAGASQLPNGCGAWLRVLGPDARSVATVIRSGWSAARRAILGVDVPPDRRP